MMNEFVSSGMSSRPVNMSVGKLILQETGTYNPIQNRPYVTNLDAYGMNELIESVRAHGNNGHITGSILAGSASGIVSPSATTFGDIAIANGWSEKRIRFMLEVVVEYNFGSPVAYFMQGYTDYSGVTMNGNIDPHMAFYINSMVGVSRTIVPTPYGNVVQEHIKETFQVLNDNQFNKNYMPGMGQIMRPQDVFNGMQSIHIREHANVAHGDMYDTRLMLGNDTYASSRNNTLPTNYMAKIIDGYTSASVAADFGQNQKSIFAMASNEVYETPIGNNAFIRAISDDNGTGGLTNRFTMDQLSRIDPGVKQKTTFMALGPVAQRNLHQTGSTEYWNGANRETQVATILCNAVPALMMGLVLSQLEFRSTNDAIGGIMTTAIINAQSLTTADISNHFNIFINRLEKEIIYDFTFRNQEIYKLHMRVDLLGETYVSISLGNQPAVDFVMPSFSDSLFSPVITNDVHARDVLISDFEHIVTNTADAMVGTRPTAVFDNI